VAIVITLCAILYRCAIAVLPAAGRNPAKRQNWQCCIFSPIVAATTEIETRSLTPGQARLLAFIAGATVANLYYSQPLLPTIAASLRVSETSASLLVTLTQLSYGISLLLLVPAADITRRRTLFTVLLSIDTLAVAASAAAPGLAVLGGLALIMGITSVVIQMLVPFAATLAAPAERTRAIGTVLSGLLTGVLLSRTFAGIVAQFAGWRGVYAIAAVGMAVTTVVLYKLLPDLPPEIDASYGTQLRQTFTLVRTQPVLRWRSLIGACGFGSFSAFWTTVAFLLSRPPYDFNQLEIGLFALAGAAGALTSAFAGKQIDARRRLRWGATGVVQATLLASFALIGLGGAHLHWLGFAVLVVGTLVMDAAVQLSNLLGQSVIYELLPQARSRITAIYMTTMFVGGSIGSWAAAHAYDRWGWAGACAAAAAFPAIGVLGWLGAGRQERMRQGLTVDVEA
jgi:predicted MFS family arabinose efflux permease